MEEASGNYLLLLRGTGEELALGRYHPLLSRRWEEQPGSIVISIV